MVVPVAVAVVEAGVVVVAAGVLGVVIGLGEGGREVLARGHWRAEALHACDGCLCHSLCDNDLTSYPVFSVHFSLGGFVGALYRNSVPRTTV